VIENQERETRIKINQRKDNRSSQKIVNQTVFCYLEVFINRSYSEIRNNPNLGRS